MKTRTTVFAVLIVALSVLLAPVYGPEIRAHAASTSTGDDLDKDIRTVADVYALVEKNLPTRSPRRRRSTAGAIPGMLHTLDPHSNFVDPAEYREMQRRQHAQYYGVGMQITMDGPKVVVMEPFVSSPAWKAGMRRGDGIVAVDDKDTTGMDSRGVAELLRGPEGHAGQSQRDAGGATEPYTATVTRGKIETSVVDAFWVKPGIAFLRVESFEAQNVTGIPRTYCRRWVSRTSTA